jgi:mRNA interferase MazF
VRGDVHRLRAPRDARGHEQQGHRYAVILQSEYLRLSSTLVAPTSTSARPASFRPEITLDGVSTRVLVEQTQAVDPEIRLGEFAGRLTAAELQTIDRAVAAVFGLD